jgi:hypothetical protein
MLQSPEHPRPIATDVTSPELVLVDGLLGVRARAGLPEPEDTLATLERDIAFRRLGARGSSFDDVADGMERSHALATVGATGRTGWKRRRLPLVAGGIAATFAAAVLLGVQVSLRGNLAGAESREVPPTPTTSPVTTTESQPSAQPATPVPPVESQPSAQPATPRPPVSRKRTQKARAPRLFAWAPVPGATAYLVELFRDNDVIYSSEVPVPRLELGSRWKFRGRMQTLGPGTYRWYVWPVRSGRRDTRATVQTELSVP